MPAEGPPEIPIFPLQSVVLFPRVQAPLYIFEQRYRQMTAEALAGSRRIGMVVVQPDHADAMEGDPPVFPIGCEGEIRQSQPHPDGTYHIVLHGLSRFRIVEEPPRQEGRLYRVARIDRCEEDEGLDAHDQIAELRGQVLSLMRRLLPARAESFEPSLFAEVDDATFVNAFCQAIDFHTLEKQELLEMSPVIDRIDHLTTLLRFRLAEVHGPGDAGTVH